MKILSGILILITAFMSVKHGWGGVTMKPEVTNQMAQWGLDKTLIYILSALTILGALLILFPQTFFAGNLLHATIFIVLIGFQLKSANIKAALIEIPFLLIPLVLIYLGHPLKK